MRPMLRSAVSWLRRISLGIALLCYGYMVVSVFLQVLGRYTFIPISIGNAVETAAFAQVWLASMGAGLALRKGAVFAVDLLPSLLPLALARALSIFIALISILFLCVVIYGGVLLTQKGFKQTSPTLLIPMWTVFIAIPIGMFVLAIEVALRVVERWDNPFAQIGSAERDPA